MKNIKFFLTIILTLCLTQHIKSQSTFNIITTGFEQYSPIISNANLESYRLKTKRDTITFVNGFKVELLSAKELAIMGKLIDINTYSDYRDPDYVKPTFRLVIPSGSIPQAPGQQPYIIALYTHKEK